MILRSRKLGIILAIALVLAATYPLLPSSESRVEAAVSDWQKGISVYPGSAGDFGSSALHQSLTNARNVGANTVAFIIPMCQADDRSSDIYNCFNTPSDTDLTSAANFAHSLGMKVVFKPHLDPQNGDWRANINVADRDRWYGEYGAMLNHLGDLAQQTKSEGIVVGTELISMADFTINSDNTERWQGMIASLRQHFSGFLTYSANWGGSDYAEEPPHVGFWSSLDYIGLSAYYPLAQGQNNPSVDNLKGSWSSWDTSKIKALHNQFGKPVIFTEIGYRSVDGAHNVPFQSGTGGNYNPTEQDNDYQALLGYWNNVSYMSGVYLWDWGVDPNAGGQGNTDYTPQNKPALSTLASWFGGSGTTTSPPPPDSTPSSASGTWDMSSGAQGLVAGQQGTISLNVAINGQATNVIVDAEVYNSAGQRVTQQFFSNQNISSAATHYDVPFTPPGNGSYTMKVGIFNSDWTQLFIWNDSVGTLNVGTSGGTTPPPPTQGTTLDIWWPTDGATMSGVQPFKGLVEDRDPSTYSMSWQVDGGVLVQMGDNQTDYPHKESDVDVSAWTWNGNGPYKLTFTAKDASGNTISQKSVSIMVMH